MVELNRTELDDMQRNMELARAGLLVSARQLRQLREKLVRATIDATDLIVQAGNISKALPDPTQYNGQIAEVKDALEELEDMLFNPQDKADILAAINTRPNLAADLMAEKIRLVDEAVGQVADIAADQDAFRSYIRRRAIAFCAAVAITAAAAVWVMG